MSPIVINLSHVEYDAVMSNLDEFERFGFDVGEFGFNTVGKRDAYNSRR